MEDAREQRVSPPAIRQDEGAGRDSPLHESCQRASRGVQHDLEAHPTGGLTAHFDRAHNQRLLQQLGASFQTCLLTAQGGFVDLDLVLFTAGVSPAGWFFDAEAVKRFFIDASWSVEVVSLEQCEQGPAGQYLRLVAFKGSRR